MNRRDIHAALTGPTAKTVAAVLGIGAVALGLFAWGVATRGPLNTILYAFLFLFALAFFPTAIAILGHGVPNVVGQLHLILGAVAFDHHYLVQREHGWEWCPGERGRVWIDGEWHDVGGHENYSVLCWRPFGVLRYKDDDTWARERVDQAAASHRPDFETDPSTATDGGAEQLERGGIPEADRPAISGQEGTWLVDLKRVYTHGVKKIGDTDLIETAEEVIERGQVGDGRVSGLPGWAQTLIGLVLGLVAGFGYVLL